MKFTISTIFQCTVQWYLNTLAMLYQNCLYKGFEHQQHLRYSRDRNTRKFTMCLNLPGTDLVKICCSILLMVPFFHSCPNLEDKWLHHHKSIPTSLLLSDFLLFLHLRTGLWDFLHLASHYSSSKDLLRSPPLCHAL